MKRTVRLSLLCDWERLDTFYYSKEKESSKEKLPGGIILKCNEKGCMTEKLMVKWLRGVWDRKSGALPKKREMLVWYACKRNVIEKVKTL
jgi:hypothetical protein